MAVLYPLATDKALFVVDRCDVLAESRYEAEDAC